LPQAAVSDLAHISGESRQATGVHRLLHGTRIRFQVLYVFLVLTHDRRRILHFNVTAHPTAEWVGQQLREAFPFDQLPHYLLRDRDAIFGNDFREQVRDMGI
jgi:putative transposase